jgi:endonuclease YncB( thermonuclease family)
VPFSYTMYEFAIVSARTLNIRLAGIDSPEGAAFGQPGQPFHTEAKKFLSELTRNRTVRVKLLRLDQYNRAVRFYNNFLLLIDYLL